MDNKTTDYLIAKEILGSYQGKYKGMNPLFLEYPVLEAVGINREEVLDSLQRLYARKVVSSFGMACYAELVTDEKKKILVLGKERNDEPEQDYFLVEGHPVTINLEELGGFLENKPARLFMYLLNFDTKTRRLTLDADNKRYIVSLPDSFSENAETMDYVFKNQNRLIKKSEIVSGIGKPLKKPLPHIFRDLKLTGEIRKLFFETLSEKKGVHFVAGITSNDFKRMLIDTEKLEKEISTLKPIGRN